MFVSHRNPLIDVSEFPANVRAVAPVSLAKERSVVLVTGEELDIDDVIECTGYAYDFPFLSEACQPGVKDGHLSRLYKALVHVDYPTLLFIGMCRGVATMPAYEFQAQWAVAYLLGDVKVLDRDRMLEDIEHDFREKSSLGLAPNNVSNMYPMEQFFKPYQESLLALVKDPSKLSPVSDFILEYFDHIPLTIIGRPSRFYERIYPSDVDWSVVPGNHVHPLRIGQHSSKNESDEQNKSG